MTRHEFVVKGCYLIMFMCLLAWLLSMTGCASPAPVTPKRFLTEAQDAEMKEKCTDGCAVIPGPIWQEILKALSVTRI